MWGSRSKAAVSPGSVDKLYGEGRLLHERDSHGAVKGCNSSDMLVI